MPDKIRTADGEVIEFTAVPRGADPSEFPAPVPDLPDSAYPPGAVELPEAQPGDPLPEAEVVVVRPDGTVGLPFRPQYGEINMPQGTVPFPDVEDEPASLPYANGPTPNLPPHSTAVPQTVGLVDETVQQTAGGFEDPRAHLASQLDGDDEGPYQLLKPRHANTVEDRQIKTALLTKDGGINIGGVPVNHGFTVSPVQVRHIDCNDSVAELTVTFLVDQVLVEPEALTLIEDVPHHECDSGCTCQLQEPTATIIDLINRTRGSLRRFVLQRDRDDTGVSGTGIVAEGVLLSDGRALVRWLGQNSSIVMWNGLQELINVHGHGGHTRLRWIDTAPPTSPHPDSR